MAPGSDVWTQTRLRSNRGRIGAKKRSPTAAATTVGEMTEENGRVTESGLLYPTLNRAECCNTPVGSNPTAPASPHSRLAENKKGGRCL